MIAFSASNDTGGTITWTPGERVQALLNDAPPPIIQGIDLIVTPRLSDLALLLSGGILGGESGQKVLAELEASFTQLALLGLAGMD